MADELVHVVQADGVARVELDKPPVNAFDPALVEAVAAAVAALAVSDARVVVFTGRGPCFAAGGDIKWMYGRVEEADATALHRYFRGIQQAFVDVERLPMPTIAAVHGSTLGGGLELALACDIRVAADDTRIGFPEATLGLLPGAGGTQRLTELLGRSLALELMYTGRSLDAEEAKELGLVNRVVPADDLLVATDELVAEILRATPAALTAIKSCVRIGVEDGIAAGLRTESALVDGLAADPEAIRRLTDFTLRRGSSKPPAAATTATASEGA